MNSGVVIVGCGSLLRGDDAAGPILVRTIAELGCPRGVRLVDCATAGIDVALEIAGAREVVIVDACASGSRPGAIFELPGQAIQAPPLGALNLHTLRWDSALALAQWYLKDHYPEKVTVILIEIGGLDYGSALSEPVRLGVDAVARELIARFA